MALAGSKLPMTPRGRRGLILAVVSVSLIAAGSLAVALAPEFLSFVDGDRLVVVPNPAVVLIGLCLVVGGFLGLALAIVRSRVR